MAALRGGTPARWLAEEFELFHLPSASVLPLLAARRKAERGALLVLAQGQAANLPPLRHAESEARAVAATFDGVALIGAQATETALRERAPQAGMLHIAAHGQLNATAPLFSRLVLAGEDDLETARDGMLEVREIYGLDLRRSSLVVLSACQTQLGALSRGDDMVGLNRAFLAAGAPSVVASLWRVDDQATAMLMTAFYRHLKGGLGPAAALRAAQADVRARHSDPFLWSAFLVTGQPE
jgi:CHAT domain-containing protein